MKHHRLIYEIPVRSAVIAWQPMHWPRTMGEPAAGAVAVFKFLDPGERAFAMTHGACWRDWSEHPVCELIETLIWLKRVMVSKYHIDAQAVETAFAAIPEYRKYRAARLSRF